MVTVLQKCFEIVWREYFVKEVPQPPMWKPLPARVCNAQCIAGHP
jgi:hypothetical protein